MFNLDDLKNMKKTSLFFTIENFFLLIIVLYMINNLEHSTYVYYTISKKQLSTIFGWQYADWLQSIIVIIVLDLSVIAWVRLGRYWEAGVFEVLILVINLLYYQWHIPGVFEYDKEIYPRIAEFLFAGMFTFGVISFAKIYSDRLNKNIDFENFIVLKQQLFQQIQNLEKDNELSSEIIEGKCIVIENLNHQLVQRTNEIEDAKSEIVELNNMVSELKGRLSRKRANDID